MPGFQAYYRKKKWKTVWIIQISDESISKWEPEEDGAGTWIPGDVNCYECKNGLVKLVSKPGIKHQHCNNVHLTCVGASEREEVRHIFSTGREWRLLMCSTFLFKLDPKSNKLLHLSQCTWMIPQTIQQHRSDIKELSHVYRNRQETLSVKALHALETAYECTLTPANLFGKLHSPSFGKQQFLHLESWDTNPNI